MPVTQKTVLSIDGGGIRGIIPARILAKIEKRTLCIIRGLIENATDQRDDEKAALHATVDGMVKTRNGEEFIPTATLFTLIAGASTGGILALALTKPVRNDSQQPQYTAKELADLYPEDGREIFRLSFWQRLPGVGHLLRGFQAKYSSNGITDVLEERLGDTRLRNALTSVLIPSYEMGSGQAWFFKSTRAEEQQSTHDFAMTDVALATSAAPTYFEDHQMPVTTEENEVYTGQFIDGGVYANHPAMCAFVEAQNMEGENILLVSLGTGARMPFSEGRRGSGTIFWVRRILNVISDGASDTVSYQLDQLAHMHEGFYRFQPTLTENIELDDVDVDTTDRLEEVASDFIDGIEDSLEEVCHHLG